MDVILPHGLAVSGEVLISHMRSIDTLARPMIHAGRVPLEVVLEAQAGIGPLLGITA
jgi:mRNA interferase MazF